MAKVFSSHPLTDDRIKGAQKNIQEILQAKPEYVVTTSEFNDVKGRLMAMHNRRRVDDKDLNKPRLRKGPGGGTTPIDGDNKDGTKSGGSSDDDERPTLKRRPS
jgi:predicted Zn-dependent protease